MRNETTPPAQPKTRSIAQLQYSIFQIPVDLTPIQKIPSTYEGPQNIMFSANENLMLREHKRRVVNYVEETMPEEALDNGASVMVMQTTCRTPGCVPLETAIAIVFPRIPKKEWIEGLKESCGGAYKTKILLPLSEVTKDDVLDSLPPEFEGGRKTWERTCLQLRDLVFGRASGLVGSGDTEAEIEDRRLLIEYLRSSMTDYLAGNCVAPELGKPFQLETKNVESESSENANSTSIVTKSGAELLQGSMKGNGNFVIRRQLDASEGTSTSVAAQNESIINEPSSSTNSDRNLVNSRNNSSSESAMDWRRRQSMTQSLQLPSSDNILQRLSDREHAPGVRSPGCPCCDPDNIVNIVDGMML